MNVHYLGLRLVFTLQCSWFCGHNPCSCPTAALTAYIGFLCSTEVESQTEERGKKGHDGEYQRRNGQITLMVAQETKENPHSQTVIYCLLQY